MQLARVIGNVISTHKDQSLTGHKLLVLQPVTPLRTDIGRAVVAVDSVGAGVGEEVFFVQGRERVQAQLPGQIRKPSFQAKNIRK